MRSIKVKQREKKKKKLRKNEDVRVLLDSIRLFEKDAVSTAVGEITCEHGEKEIVENQEEEEKFFLPISPKFNIKNVNQVIISAKKTRNIQEKFI